MWKFQKVSGLVSVLALLSACGGGSGGEKPAGSADNDVSTAAAISSSNASNFQEATPSESVPVTIEMLQGRWLSTCEVDEDGVSASSLSEYTGDSFTTYFGLFQDTNCQSPMFEFGLLGKINLGQTSYASNGTSITEFDVLSDSVTMRASYRDVADYFNEKAFCNRTSWVAGEYQDVTNCDIASDMKTIYDIVQVDNDRHYWGDWSGPTSSSSGHERPQSIDYGVVYSRIADNGQSVLSDGSTQEYSETSRGTFALTLKSQLEKLKNFRKRH